MDTYRQTIEPIARELGVKEPALQKWRDRRRVPHKWRLPILQKAQARGIIIDLEMFDFVERIREPGA